MMWANMRLPAEQHERLRTYVQRLQKIVNASPGRYPSYLSEGPISMATALRYLLDQKDAHTRRGKESMENQVWVINPDVVQLTDDATADA